MCIVHLLIYNVRSFSHIIFIYLNFYLTLKKKMTSFHIYHNNTKTACLFRYIIYITNIIFIYIYTEKSSFIYYKKNLRITEVLQYRTIFFLYRWHRFYLTSRRRKYLTNGIFFFSLLYRYTVIRQLCIQYNICMYK